MSQAVQYKLHPKGYGVITLNRPEKRNAISLEMAEQFKKHLKKAAQDEVKFLVVTGAGDKMFCAGGDLSDLHAELSAEDAFAKLYSIKEALYELVSFPVPTIGLLNGDALGGGCELATACDFRIARESTKFGFIQGRLGILPGWGGGTLLYEKVHHTFAYHWLTESSVYHANYLKDKGWIHQVVSDEEWRESDEILEPYINKSLRQLQILKKQYKKSISSLSLSSQMSEEVRDASLLWGSEKHKRAVGRFAKR